MRPDPPFRLTPQSGGPIQQSPVTCGSASLTVARMLVNPAFARWLVSGVRTGQKPDPRTEPQRFAEYERVVMRRTNGLVRAGGRLNLPWPRALGTPPWGARAELEHGAATPGVRYQTRLVRLGAPARLRSWYAALVHLVDEGRPALLFVGSRWLPRHVALVLPGAGDRVLDIYDPATGTVSELPVQPFADRRLRVAGWDVPWFVVQPRRRGPE
ncbi:MAG TPA: hypothetical protein VFJ97_04630 [Dermatophilaceae bacterium]|nr:hypothetical protein [Dermatophilaceae bacterium]